MEVTPRRIYHLRSSNRTIRDDQPTISIRKRVSGNMPVEKKSQKRQRTQQSIGSPFASPDAMNSPRHIPIEEQSLSSFPCINKNEERTVTEVVANLRKRISDTITKTPFGSFGCLPKDVVYQMMSRTPYPLLGSLATTSNSWMEAVYAYVDSGTFRNRWLSDIQNAPFVLPESENLSKDPFYSMGILIRRMTFNHVWEARLAFLQSFMKLAEEAGAPIAGLGRLIHAFAVRPDDDIETKQIDSLVSMAFVVIPRLLEEIDEVFKRPDEEHQLSELDNLPSLLSEIEIRDKVMLLFLNNGSLDPSYGINKYFLSSLMSFFKNRHGALPTPLFYLLFAPTTLHHNFEVINWHRFSILAVNTLEDAQELKPLSKALNALLICRNLKQSLPWTKNTIFNLMEEITTYPNPWSMNTFVSLQVLEPELVPIGVVARMHRNHEDEAGDMICTMKMLLHRWEMDVIGVMDRVMDNIKAGLRPNQRRSLFDRCWDWHQKSIDDYRSRLGRFYDIRIEIESQIEVMPVLMKLL